jgi:hypothetical protein
VVEILSVRYGHALFNTKSAPLINIHSAVTVSCSNPRTNTQRIVKKLKTKSPDPVAKKAPVPTAE